MKKLLLTSTILVAMIAPAMAVNPLDTTAQWERESRNLVPKGNKSPEARALVNRANSLLSGEPTCDAMLEASSLLNRATDLYIKVKDFSGDVRNTSRRASWLENLANAGRCNVPLPHPRPKVEGM